jgi:hypothetical protein
LPCTGGRQARQSRSRAPPRRRPSRRGAPRCSWLPPLHTRPCTDRSRCTCRALTGFVERRRERKAAERAERAAHEHADHEVFAYADQVLADDLVTQEEEDHLAELLEAATGSATIPLGSKFHEIGRRVAIASANAGRLPEIEPQHLIVKKGELVHVEVQAHLQKEVTISHREFVGGGSGVSIRVAKGVRVRYGGGPVVAAYVNAAAAAIE